MFRPPSLLAPQIVPTAANAPAGQPGLLRPSRTRFVTSPRIGYANRPMTGNWRYGDLHPARLRPCRLLLTPSRRFRSGCGSDFRQVSTVGHSAPPDPPTNFPGGKPGSAQPVGRRNGLGSMALGGEMFRAMPGVFAAPSSITLSAI